MPAIEKYIAKNVRIDWMYPENLQSNFVSSIVVQHQPDYFILSFFELWPPAILGETDEEKQKKLDSIDHISAKCVARLVVTPSKMKEFVEAISENLASYEKNKQLHHNLDEDK